MRTAREKRAPRSLRAVQLGGKCLTNGSTARAFSATLRASPREGKAGWVALAQAWKCRTRKGGEGTESRRGCRCTSSHSPHRTRNAKCHTRLISRVSPSESKPCWTAITNSITNNNDGRVDVGRRGPRRRPYVLFPYFSLLSVVCDGVLVYSSHTL